MKNNVPIDIVEGIFDCLYERKGFDSWWDDIDVDIQDEIREDLYSVTKNILDNPDNGIVGYV